MNELQTLVEIINKKIAEFQDNAAQNVVGNKAAGSRARKASVELGKLFKEYRNLSVKATK